MSAYNKAYLRKKSGGAIFVLFALGVLLTLGLYFVKTRAQTAKSEAGTLERQLRAGEAVIFKLKSELAHLESPARVEAIARETLGMTTVPVERVIGAKDIEQHFPLADEIAEANSEVNSEANSGEETP